MGSIMGAIRDDEDEWERFCATANINDCGWRVYSFECTTAHEGFLLGHTGPALKLYVKQTVEQADLDKKHSNEWSDLHLLKSLQEKYG
jgi:hypothetical protein